MSLSKSLSSLVDSINKINKNPNPSQQKLKNDKKSKTIPGIRKGFKKTLFKKKTLQKKKEIETQRTLQLSQNPPQRFEHVKDANNLNRNIDILKKLSA